jgi:hypothetical protein
VGDVETDHSDKQGETVMPRYARIKPDDMGMYYHLTNRISGIPGEYPFGDAEKEELINLVKVLSRFFTIEVLSCQAMGNHYHIVCYAPADLLSPRQACERYNRFYQARNKPPLSPDDPYCEVVARRMRDISWFMRQLQQQFTSWYNRTRIPHRRGSLWAQRFKSVILERDTALWNCLCYVEMNAVRAGLVSDPGDYRFGTWGEWCATGHHPFGENLRRHLVAYEGTEARACSLEEIRKRFRVEFARIQASESGATDEEVAAAMESAARTPAFTLRLNRRVRYWTDGLIIGGKTFVREVAGRLWDRECVHRHRLQPAHGSDVDKPLYAYRRLHTPASS